VSKTLGIGFIINGPVLLLLHA